MNQKLQRIEAALHQIETHPRSQPLFASKEPLVESGNEGDRSVSLPPLSLAESSPTQTTQTPAPSDKIPMANLETLLQTSPEVSIKALSLPRVGTPGFTSHHNAANPSLALNLLKELEGMVSNWQIELGQVLRQIQAIYLEGPILDGWLESYTCQEGSAPEFRHAEVDCLMTYVEKLSKTSDSEAAHTPTSSALSAGYRLCGMNEEGQVWFRHCPAEQVPSVSVAILRYQRLKNLLSQKDTLQNRLSHLAESLIELHSDARGFIETK